MLVFASCLLQLGYQSDSGISQGSDLKRLLKAKTQVCQVPILRCCLRYHTDGKPLKYRGELDGASTGMVLLSSKSLEY